MKYDTTPKFFIFIWILVGSIIIFFSISHVKKYNKYIETTANFYKYEKNYFANNEEDKEYNLIYKYKVDGNEYQIIEKSNSKIPASQEIKIKYNPSQPQNAFLKKQNPVLGEFFWGAVLIAVGVITYIKIRKG